MQKILFWLLVGLVLWLVIRIVLTSARKTGKGGGDDQLKQIPMLQCAYCGIHFSRADAVTAEDGRVFCSQVHSDAAHRTQDV